MIAARIAPAVAPQTQPQQPPSAEQITTAMWAQYAQQQQQAQQQQADAQRMEQWQKFLAISAAKPSVGAPAPDAPQLDFVFTVCDNAAGEQCPYWPGKPMTAHWGIADPAAVKGTPEEIARAFRDAFVILDRRIGLFLSLPLATLDQLAIKQEIDTIGRS